MLKDFIVAELCCLEVGNKTLKMFLNHQVQFSLGCYNFNRKIETWRLISYLFGEERVSCKAGLQANGGFAFPVNRE